MLPAAPLPIPSPALAQKPVETMLAHFATALPWLTNAYGLVQTGVLNDGKNRIPQLYQQDGSLHSLDLYPDQASATLSFFEYNGPADIAFDDPVNQSGTITHQLAAVVWLNLTRIDPKRPHDFSPELALDFLTRGLLQSHAAGVVTPGEIEQRSERVFQRYNFPQERQQLLMWPFAGFRIPFTVSQRYVACAVPFTPLP